MYYGFEHFVGHINHVTDNLYIGSIRARDPKPLTENNIRHVISVLTSDEHLELHECSRADGEDIEEYEFDLDDDDRADILTLLPKIMKVINEVENENVLVHCHAGI